jgi:hypothetical protein
MVSKEKFVKFIEKFHLAGIIPSAIIEVKDKTLSAIVKSESGDVRGYIELEDFELEDGEIGCYSTANLLKLLTILDNDIKIVQNTRGDGHIFSLEFSDSKGKKVIFATHERDIIDRDGKKAKVNSYDVKVSLNNENIADILQSYGALNSNITFLPKKDKLYAVFNYSKNNEDNIEIQLDTEEMDEDFEAMTFDTKYIKNIFEVNKKRYDDGTLELSNKGIARIYFKDNDSMAEYWIVKLQD